MPGGGVRSSYAPKLQSETKAERSLLDRLSAARQRRQDDVMGKMSDETLTAVRLYQQEKARAALKGRPTLPTLEEYRHGVLPEETPTK